MVLSARLLVMASLFCELPAGVSADGGSMLDAAGWHGGLYLKAAKLDPVCDIMGTDELAVVLSALRSIRVVAEDVQLALRFVFGDSS